MNLAGVERALCARRTLAQELRFVSECTSTSDVLREEVVADGPAAKRSVLLAAGTQTGGRGRRARDWWSGPPGANLSCTLSIPSPPEPALLLSLAGACALAEAVSKRVRQPVALKWPNDLLVGGDKAAGLLGEVPARPAAEGPAVALLGLGVNVGAAPPAEGLPYETTRLADHGPVRVESLLLAWLWGMERRLARLQARGPADLEAECLKWLRNWAPEGVRPAAGGNAGPLLEFSVSGGLAWGREDAITRLPLGQVPDLLPL